MKLEALALGVCCVLLSTSCKTPVKPPARPSTTADDNTPVVSIPPPLPPTNVFRKSFRAAVPPANTPNGILLSDFIYPSNASNYWWRIYCSDDLRTWRVLTYPFRVDGPATQAVAVVQTNRVRFYRAVGSDK